MPFRAIVHIGPRHWSTGEDGWPCLTPNLMTEGEIDHYVSALKADLQDLSGSEWVSRAR
jgi:hypothetical protein